MSDDKPMSQEEAFGIARGALHDLNMDLVRLQKNADLRCVYTDVIRQCEDRLRKAFDQEGDGAVRAWAAMAEQLAEGDTP